MAHGWWLCGVESWMQAWYGASRLVGCHSIYKARESCKVTDRVECQPKATLIAPTKFFFFGKYVRIVQLFVFGGPRHVYSEANNCVLRSRRMYRKKAKLKLVVKIMFQVPYQTSEIIRRVVTISRARSLWLPKDEGPLLDTFRQSTSARWNGEIPATRATALELMGRPAIQNLSLSRACQTRTHHRPSRSPVTQSQGR